MILLSLLVFTMIAGSAFGETDSRGTFDVPLSRNRPNCVKSPTTASGSAIQRGRKFCSGELIFEDNFDFFDFEIWDHENTLAGGGNWEFQWYTNNRSNSFVEDGKLFIRPTLTADEFGEGFLTSGTINLNGNRPIEQCTNGAFYGCERQGTETHILNPVKSARVRTLPSFNFKYGRAEVRAKLPTGDWLWPAIWLLPKRNAYGTWPASGEIDLMEGRGNEDFTVNDVQIGTAQVGQTLHFGPNPSNNGWNTATGTKNAPAGAEFNKDFNTFGFTWTPDNMTVTVNGEATQTFEAGEGFWKRAGFDKRNLENPWRSATKMAPFDQEFHFIFNVAVGGVNGYFPDSAKNPTAKPWLNSSPNAATNFWDGRSNWLPSWNLEKNDGKDAALQIDYIKVWAL
ncbi:beta-1,3-glucan-binding protein-like [Toxorhynchites rutilus septentrionalis]|uniref:beta-1,3-glucan-binding protein-like n=1 Tax=Toxorhynchites rutilus septentrionalis TaxID=329112 RepID=UPI0024788795|nr:beta-1,3-glucan-binding protein-like [Toxorhynchites rutilus septentrionalis]